MSATISANVGTPAAEHATSGHLKIQLSTEDDSCVVRAAGELDAASRDQLVAASTAGNHPAMVIDLADVTFMDCSGYRSLVAAQLAVERDGRSLTTRGQTGQPARLFELIGSLEHRRCSRGVSQDARRTRVTPSMTF